jgi:hypothetical protein
VADIHPGPAAPAHTIHPVCSPVVPARFRATHCADMFQRCFRSQEGFGLMLSGELGQHGERLRTAALSAIPPSREPSRKKEKLAHEVVQSSACTACRLVAPRRRCTAGGPYLACTCCPTRISLACFKKLSQEAFGVKDIDEEFRSMLVDVGAALESASTVLHPGVCPTCWCLRRPASPVAPTDSGTLGGAAHVDAFSSSLLKKTVTIYDTPDLEGTSIEKKVKVEGACRRSAMRPCQRRGYMRAVCPPTRYNK